MRELRAIGPDGVYVGFYDDPELFAKHAQDLNANGCNIYSCINPIIRNGQPINQPPIKGGAASKDKDILRRVCLPYDIDCRQKPASDADMAKAAEVGRKIIAFWSPGGEVKPEVVNSGNGIHLRYIVDLPNDEHSYNLVRAILARHSAEFSTPEVKVDVSVSNASRILREAGYTNHRGGKTVKRLRTALGALTQEQLEDAAGTLFEQSRGVGMPKGWDPEVELTKAGLAYNLRRDGARLSFDYYQKMGKCLLKNDAHSSGNNSRKARFIWDPTTSIIAHQCFSDDCRELTAKTPTALLNLGIDVDALSLEEKLEVMNQQYTYVDEGDFVVRLDGMRLYDAAKFTKGGHLANRIHIEGKKRLKMARAWLEWEKRRETGNMVYEPGKPRFYGRSINRWQGMGVEPRKGDITPWTQLIERIIPHLTGRKWFEEWCAYPLQNLGAKLKSAVIIWGTMQGTGKTTIATTIASTLCRIYGRNAIAVSESHLHAPFNEWALDRQFICADEITAGDKRGTADMLKDMIAGHELIQVSQKFQPLISIRNSMNFLFTSNHADCFYLEPHDRRYFVVEVTGEKLPSTFFDGYYDWLENGGAASLYQHLLELDLSSFNPHVEPPLTRAKTEMIHIGKSELDHWLETRRGLERELVFTAEGLLRMMRHELLVQQKVSVRGMSAALKRLGAVSHPSVKLEGQMKRFWTWTGPLPPTHVLPQLKAQGKLLD